MTFDEALKALDIEDYKERIWNSNSHGELFHVYDYITVAEYLTNDMIPEEERRGVKPFREWFIGMVEHANSHWDRPESVYQHLIKMMLNKSDSCS